MPGRGRAGPEPGQTNTGHSRGRRKTMSVTWSVPAKRKSVSDDTKLGLSRSASIASTRRVRVWVEPIVVRIPEEPISDDFRSSHVSTDRRLCFGEDYVDPTDLQGIRRHVAASAVRYGFQFPWERSRPSEPWKTP